MSSLSPLVASRHAQPLMTPWPPVAKAKLVMHHALTDTDDVKCEASDIGGVDTTGGLFHSPPSITRHAHQRAPSPSSTSSSPSHLASPPTTTPRQVRSISSHPSPSAWSSDLPPLAPRSAGSGGGNRAAVSLPSSPKCTPLAQTRGLFHSPRQSLIAETITATSAGPHSANSSPRSSHINPTEYNSIPKLINHKRASLSVRSSAFIAARHYVLCNTDMLFSVFHYIDLIQLLSISRVCHRWHAKISSDDSVVKSSRLIPVSGSVDFNDTSTGTKTRPIPTARQKKRRSFIGKLFSKLSCSAPVSPEDGDSRKLRSMDDSGINRSTQTKPIVVNKYKDYFYHRHTAELSSLPTNKLQQKLLLSRISHVRHLRLTGRAERKIDSHFLSLLIETFSHNATPLLTLSVCGCHSDTLYNFSTMPLLSPSFISSHSINHQKGKPIALNDSLFTMLFQPSVSLAMFSELTTLSLANCTELSENCFLLLNNLPMLISLNLSHCSSLTDDSLEFVVRHNQKIKHLNLNYNRSLTNATPYYIASFLSQSLESLSLNGNALINDSGIAQLSVCRSLSSLHIQSLEFLTDKGIVALSQCQLLSQLDVSQCSYVSNKSLAQLALFCPLVWINLSGCTMISDRTIHYLTSTRHGGGDSDDTVTATRPIITTAPSSMIVGLDEDADNHQWMIQSRQASRQSSPAITPRRLSFANTASPSPSPSLSSLSSLLSKKIVSTMSMSLLRHMSLANCTSVSDQSIRQISTHAPLLESLDVSGCLLLSDNGIVLLGLTLKSLRNLMLANCVKLTNTALLALSELRLRCLSLSGCPLLTDDGFVSLSLKSSQSSSLLKSLEWLSLNECAKLSDRAVYAIATSLSSLQSLALTKCPLITDQSCLHLAVFASSLREIALGTNELITDTGYTTLMKLPSMAHCDFNHCKLLTGETLLKLSPNKPVASTKYDAKSKKRLAAMNVGLASIDDDSNHDNDSDGNSDFSTLVESTRTGTQCWSPSLKLMGLRGCAKVSEGAVDTLRQCNSAMKFLQ